MSIFQDIIGCWIHVYLDNIFVYSDLIEEHERHLGLVFERLCQNMLYLKWKKCKSYAKHIECLRHIIDDQGMHPYVIKFKNPGIDIQWFVGLVNYISNFLPDVSAYTGPLMFMMQNRLLFQWQPLHQHCFDIIKCVYSKTLVIRSIDPHKEDHIWLIYLEDRGQSNVWPRSYMAGL